MYALQQLLGLVEPWSLRKIDGFGNFEDRESLSRRMAWEYWGLGISIFPSKSYCRGNVLKSSEGRVCDAISL
jgi:hypothetical protein